MTRSFDVFIFLILSMPCWSQPVHPEPRGGNFFLDLASLWPQHENIQGLAEAANNGNTTANYTVIFESTWSALTHPNQFPSSPHFSGLVGGTHHGPQSFWVIEELASPGIKNMAEFGSKTLLINEVDGAISLGTAGFVLSGGGISVSPGTIEMNFSIDRAFPRVTLVSMLAPSPDWFIGVAGLPLFDEGQWRDEVVVVLYPFDAGTDSGPLYHSPNNPTLPPELIYPIESDPFLVEGVVPPLGTFTFLRTLP